MREKWIFTQNCMFFKERTWGISEMAMSSDPDHHFVHGFKEREREREEKKSNSFPGYHVLHDVHKIPIFLTSIPCSFAWPVVSSCFSFECFFCLGKFSVHCTLHCYWTPLIYLRFPAETCFGAQIPSFPKSKQLCGFPFFTRVWFAISQALTPTNRSDVLAAVLEIISRRVETEMVDPRVQTG